MYTKEFLVEAFVSRYYGLSVETCLMLYEMVWKFYDTVTREQFRVYCSLDAEAIRKFKLESVGKVWYNIISEWRKAFLKSSVSRNVILKFELDLPR